MRKTSRLITFLLCLIIAVGCGNTHWFCHKKDNQGDNSYGAGVTMISLYNMGITNHQLDSICVVDGLSQDFNDWINAYFIDYETRDTIFKHTFVKNEDGVREVVYIVTEWKDSLAITKRLRK